MFNETIDIWGIAHEAYDAPENLFTYSFLGQFNKFKGIKNSKTGKIKPIFTYDKRDKELKKSLVDIFARPYEMEIFANNNKDSSLLECKILHSRHLGLTVNVELQNKKKTIIYAEISKNDFQKNPHKNGDVAFLKLKNFRTF